MHMRMVLEVLAPSVQDSGDADVGAKVLGIAQRLVPRSDHDALAFLIRQPELLHNGTLGRLLVWCLNNPEVLRALSAWD